MPTLAQLIAERDELLQRIAVASAVLEQAQPQVARLDAEIAARMAALPNQS